MKYVTFEKIGKDIEKYWENVERIRPEISCRCELCGKPILNEEKAPWVHLLTFGAYTLEEKCELEEHDQGWFQFGNDCYKKFLRLYKEAKNEHEPDCANA